MSRHIHTASGRNWLWLALVSGSCFLIVTLLQATGLLHQLTIQIEHWLIGRPLSQFDCTLEVWRSVGNPRYSLILFGLIGIFCLVARYRWRAIFCLGLLFLVGTALEVAGKVWLEMPVPQEIHYAREALSCHQMARSAPELRWQVGAGMWWLSPPVPEYLLQRAQQTAQMPLHESAEIYVSSDFPSGHALRVCFMGLIAAWLFYRHIKQRWLGRTLATLTMVGAMLVSWIQFYIGAHFIVDTIGGITLGISLAAIAIYLLIHNERQRQRNPVTSADPDSDASRSALSEQAIPVGTR